MLNEDFKNKQLGAFIIPTGVGASIGGYAGDASTWARRFAKETTLIVNPNVVNAGGFSGITENMLYVEGYTLDEFFRGNINLAPTENNKIGVVFDKEISEDVLNIHINTINAVKTVYDIDIIYEITKENVGVEFFVDPSGISTGGVKNIQTLLPTAKSLINKGCDAIAIVCRFSDEIQNADYENGVGVDPIGGVEAIISHYISKELKVPCAHSPAFEDYSISTKLVSAKASSEYITPTFLPCILLGLHQAPKIVSKEGKKAGRQEDRTIKSLPSGPHALLSSEIDITDIDFLIMPYNCLGSTPIFEAIKRGIKVYAVKENSTLLNVTKDLLNLDGIIEIDTYEECLKEVLLSEKYSPDLRL